MLLSDGTFSGERYDCFVVGSGPAGLSLATALGEAGKRVLVFESGEPNLIRHELSNTIGYGHYPGEYWNHHWVRTLGGTSNVWSGWCTVPRELDLDNPATGTRWPIGHAELMPYWQRAAAILEQPEALIGFETAALPGFSYRPVIVTLPARFGVKYLPTLRESARVDLVPGCSVVSLGASESRSLITGVEYFDHRLGIRRRFPVKPEQRMVLAAGGIGNAQLLLQPGLDAGTPVGNESGQVGRFLMEHPVFTRVGECATDERLERLWPGARAVGIHGLVADRETSIEHGLFGCHLQCASREDEHPMTGYLTRRYGRRFHRYVLNARLEMLPSSANHVALTGERDASGLHRPSVRCVLDARDFVNVETTLRVLGERLVRHDRGRVRVNNDRIYQDVRGGGHIMGTTRMGIDRSSSVVDRHCQVHGYANLFVAGSSVFPTGGGYANPTMTIVALSLRLADRLAAAS